MIGAQPCLQPAQALLRVTHAQRQLVRARRAGKRRSLGRVRGGPALGRAEDDYRVRLAAGLARRRALADGADAVVGVLEQLGEAQVHVDGVPAVLLVEARGEDHGLVAQATEVALELARRRGGEHGGRRDLVAVHVEHGQHGAVRDRAHELAGAPCRGDGGLLRLAVAHDGDGEEPGAVERRTERMTQRVAQLAAGVDGAGEHGRAVAGQAMRGGVGAHELREARLVIRERGVPLGERTVQKRAHRAGGAAVARAHHHERRARVRRHEAVDVGVEEVEPRYGPPVSQGPRL